MNTAEQLSRMSLEELQTATANFQLAVLKLGAFLAERCESVEDAQRHIRLALELPQSVVERASARYERTAQSDGLPTIPEHAAMIARMIATVQVIDTAIARAQAGATLQ